MFVIIESQQTKTKGDKLNGVINEYNKSFEILMKRKEVKNIVKEYIIKLEITYQKEQYITQDLWERKKKYYKKRGISIRDVDPNFDTYNPHFHVVIAVNKSYFKDAKSYITHDR